MKRKGLLILALTFATTFLASASGQLHLEPLVSFHWLMWSCVAGGSLLLIVGFIFDIRTTRSTEEKNCKQERKKYPY